MNTFFIRKIKTKTYIVKSRFFVYGIVSLLIIVALGLFLPINLPPLSEVASIKITDRNGILLREVFSPASGRGRIVSIDQVSPEYLSVLLATEDKRFYRHLGIDIIATFHAAYDNLRAGKIIRGGSTITQQLVRNIHPRRRTIFSKIIEAVNAIRFEIHLSKKEILTQYINRISFGNNNFGIEAASRFYFGKSAKFLTFSESAFLINLPQNPTLNNPFSQGHNSQIKRHRQILEHLLNKGQIDTAAFTRAIAQYPQLVIHHDFIQAPHFTNWVLSQNRNHNSIITTTLDLQLQKTVEEIIKRWLNECASYNVTNAAALVIDNSTGEILSYVGSSDFWDEEHSGQVDGVCALRQPGSSIKPFTYALALTQGYTAATVLPDISVHLPTPGGDFVPNNYDRTFHGPVRLRTALGCSYNVPAVRVTAQIGVDNLLKFLRTCDFKSLQQPSTEYGLGLTLGNGEVTLLQLTKAYSLFPRLGKPLNIHYQLNDITSYTQQDSTQKIPAAVAAIIGDILADNDARAPAFGKRSVLNLPFSCSVKTGTTKDYKDNLTIGWAGRYTVGVWVGNFDSSPMHNVSGVSGAGPIFHEIMIALSKYYGKPQKNVLPSGIVKSRICPLSGEIPGQWCNQEIEELFVWGTEPDKTCSFHLQNGIAYPPEYYSWAASHGKNNIIAQNTNVKEKNCLLRILFPDNNAVFSIDPVLDQSYQTIAISILVPPDIQSVNLFINDKIESSLQKPFIHRWQLQKGNHVIKVVAPTDTLFSNTVHFKVL